MNERPINMRAEEVRAILAGRKTQFRRVFRFCETNQPPACPDKFNPKAVTQPCPFGQPGDRLWVRECWGASAETNPETGMADILFRADQGTKKVCRWRSSVHMPRWASRITLEVLRVRVERLQDSSEQDALAEGYKSQSIMENPDAGRLWFRHMWQSINGPKDWDENPWVRVVEFKVTEGGAR